MRRLQDHRRRLIHRQQNHDERYIQPATLSAASRDEDSNGCGYIYSRRTPDRTHVGPVRRGRRCLDTAAAVALRIGRCPTQHRPLHQSLRPYSVAAVDQIRSGGRLNTKPVRHGPVRRLLPRFRQFATVQGVGGPSRRLRGATLLCRNVQQSGPHRVRRSTAPGLCIPQKYLGRANRVPPSTSLRGVR
jgi:hypothetical protein